MKKMILLLLAFPALIAYAQPKPATIKEYLKTFPTYPFSDPSPVPLLSEVYPYFRFDGFTTQKVNRQWKVVELENDYIRLLILPEIGGKIWAAIEKSTNRPFLYYNHTIKFRDVAMRGPWTSGGLESNFGIIGHTPNCATPVDYLTRQNEDGSVSCFIGALDLVSLTYWSVEINLPRDKAFFSTNAFWYNTTPLAQPYYHWMNAGLKAGGDLQFIYPGNKYIGHNGEHSAWPVNAQNGKDVSWYKNNDFGGYKSYHVFGKYSDFAGAYWHQDDLGMVRFANHDDKPGKKIWIWGLSRQGMIWEKLLSDTDGQYVELQSGRLFNQNTEKSSLTPFKHTSFAPYGTDTWKEYWYPVLGTKGFVTASEYGALNLQYESGRLIIRFSPVQTFADTLLIKASGKIIYKKYLHFSPLHAFSDSVQADLLADSLRVTLGEQLLTYNASPAASILSRPVDSPPDFNWDAVYGLTVKGAEAMDQKNYPEAETALGKALEKDSNYLPALVKMAELMYRNMEYARALELATRALSINTEDGGANFIYGLINDQLGNITDAKDGFDIASLDPAYRSAAYTSLAGIYFKENKLDRAIAYADRAMISNQYNIEALQIRALICRSKKEADKTNETIGAILRLDPLNHFARFEKYLLEPNAENKDYFLSQIKNEMPAQTFLELGIWYYNLGCRNEAVKLFEWAPANTEISLWVAWLKHNPVNFSALDPLRSFPFRSETAWLLENYLTSSDHWFLKYQLALIYKDRNRVAEAKELLASCGDQSSFAPFYAVRASLFAQEDSTRVLHDLQRAVLLDPQWRYEKLLAEYDILHQQYAQALTIAENFYKVHPDQYIMGMLYARTLLLNRRYAAGDKLLSKLTIIPFEGATTGRELYREAKLMQAVEYMKMKSYKKALSFINQAKEWPENLGVGKPYPENEDSRLEEWMSYRCFTALKKTEQAAAALKSILEFRAITDNTVPNFFAANALVTAWACEQSGHIEDGRLYLSKQTGSGHSLELFTWAKLVFDTKKDAPLSAGAEDVNVRILKQLISF
ncbi:MAG: DUF5107 domain-containing protein [Bacteroidota bacterium]|nr:DUF5107 domain-containing protein [Bacteroidota bacterium]